ncbi:uncharacterized protein LAESUDRAFT_527707 [Laetiporus sulphureus 93-53]|uniref:Uncharacterized protein n=1 Tax=Laetiporus sulphureus 93-53 TaxID=1314785 RepID=A0A165BCJ2_9APHY|nr:uncharacterized protein LAESUDRAFT_527707 [Laetiporus sulphureus 93-53]KZT00741.1 hypothetical protein LAESUDRAFT_527707 [Laetiporus sulphureus 93-53]
MRLHALLRHYTNRRLSRKVRYRWWGGVRNERTAALAAYIFSPEVPGGGRWTQSTFTKKDKHIMALSSYFGLLMLCNVSPFLVAMRGLHSRKNISIPMPITDTWRFPPISSTEM